MSSSAKVSTGLVLLCLLLLLSPQALAVTREPMPQLAGGFVWPVEGPIMKRFGEGSRRNHAGIDISAPRGTPIRAAKTGTVVHSGWYYDYGYTVILDHGGGVASLYGHVSKLLVSAGQPVDRGATVALVGCTGRCTGNHVHFEIRVDGRAVDPLGAGVMANRGVRMTSTRK